MIKTIFLVLFKKYNIILWKKKLDKSGLRWDIFQPKTWEVKTKVVNDFVVIRKIAKVCLLLWKLTRQSWRWFFWTVLLAVAIFQILQKGRIFSMTEVFKCRRNSACIKRKSYYRRWRQWFLFGFRARIFIMDTKTQISFRFPIGGICSTRLMYYTVLLEEFTTRKRFSWRARLILYRLPDLYLEGLNQEVVASGQWEFSIVR